MAVSKKAVEINMNSSSLTVEELLQIGKKLKRYQTRKAEIIKKREQIGY